MYTFAELLRQFRHREKLTQQELANLIGKNRSTIMAWERGDYLPKYREDVLRLAEEMALSETDTDQLLRATQFPSEYETSEPSRPRIPLQRPPRVPYFTGREKELTQLLADLQPGRAITLCGPGGIGKTALAAEALWRLAPGNDPPERFPDGIIWQDFYIESQSKVDTALKDISRTFGEEPKPTPYLAAKRVLAGRRVLLVLEGTENADNLQAVWAVAMMKEQF